MIQDSLDMRIKELTLSYNESKVGLHDSLKGRVIKETEVEELMWKERMYKKRVYGEITKTVGLWQYELREKNETTKK